MRFLCLSTSIAAFLLSACSAATQPTPISENAEIYRAVLADWVGCTNRKIYSPPDGVEVTDDWSCVAPAEAVLIVDSMVGGLYAPGEGSEAGGDRGVPQAVWADYVRANRGSRPLPGIRDVPGATVRLASSETSSPLRQTIHLSLPGFSAGRDTAYVTLFGRCGILCGRGAGLLLIRARTGWYVAEELWRGYA